MIGGPLAPALRRLTALTGYAVQPLFATMRSTARCGNGPISNRWLSSIFRPLLTWGDAGLVWRPLAAWGQVLGGIAVAWRSTLEVGRVSFWRGCHGQAGVGLYWGARREQ